MQDTIIWVITIFITSLCHKLKFYNPFIYDFVNLWYLKLGLWSELGFPMNETLREKMRISETFWRNFTLFWKKRKAETKQNFANIFWRKCEMRKCENFVKSMSFIDSTINYSKELVEFSAMIAQYLKFYYVI